MKTKTALSGQLKNLIKSKKVLVLIDGANLYFAAYKKRLPIDFEQLFKWFKKNSKLEEIIYYTAFNPEDEKQSEFISQLDEVGYKLNKKELKVFNDESKKGNLDVEICVDALMLNKKYEVLILISGDGDFAYLVEKLEIMGKKVVVLGVGGFVSYDLHLIADNYFFLDRIKEVWRKPKTKVKKVSPQIYIDEEALKAEKSIAKPATKPVPKTKSKAKSKANKPKVCVNPIF